MIELRRHKRMNTVGVRQLKADLIACLKRVQTGHRITVTDRGRAIATLIPIERPASLDWLHAMVAEGLVRWNGGKPAGLAVRIRSRGKLASQMVLDDRR